MKFKVDFDTATADGIKILWNLPADATLLDITPMGDVFVRLPDNTFQLISVTDGVIQDVTDDINEYGLPPVDFALGDEWYQLDAQAALSEEGFTLPAKACFGFRVPLFQGGEYSSANIEAEDILSYHTRVQALVSDDA
ncbi:MAG: hypothetical protein VXZ24_09085 [Pseudomonadota bacterium]|nr:hypothetical protein [Pseudomonadota bacterium]MEC8524376.1 hypothetical protein [Pseudomonadota bacterium]